MSEFSIVRVSTKSPFIDPVRQISDLLFDVNRIDMVQWSYRLRFFFSTFEPLEEILKKFRLTLYLSGFFLFLKRHWLMSKQQVCKKARLLTLNFSFCYQQRITAVSTRQFGVAESELLSHINGSSFGIVVASWYKSTPLKPISVR